MKFITEMDLRDLYKIESFTTYVLELGTKITPGARQFLVDRAVKLEQAKPTDNKSAKPAEINVSPKQTEKQQSWCSLRLRARLEVVDSLFLLSGAEIYTSGDLLLAEEIMTLGKFFRDVQKAEREQTPLLEIQFWGWPEAEIKNCANNLGKHFDISEVHVKLANGKVIALLNHLRASLREVEPAILETYWDEAKDACTRDELVEKVNIIINILCIMMWKCLGGPK